MNTTRHGASTFPSLLESFFLDRLLRQRQVSSHTVISYRDTFRLLLQFAFAEPLITSLPLWPLSWPSQRPRRHGGQCRRCRHA